MGLSIIILDPNLKLYIYIYLFNFLKFWRAIPPLVSLLIPYVVGNENNLEKFTCIKYIVPPP